MSCSDNHEFQDSVECDDRHVLAAVDGFGTGAMGMFMTGDPESIMYGLWPFPLPLPSAC